MEDNHFSDETTEVAATDDFFDVSEEDGDELVAAIEPQDETLVLRRRRVERLMDARRLSKQLFEFDENADVEDFTAQDLLDDSSDHRAEG